MFIRKAQAGSAPGHTWENDGDVHHVHDELALQLLAIPDGGFSEAEPPPAADEPAPKRRGRPPKPKDATPAFEDVEDDSDTDAEPAE